MGSYGIYKYDCIKNKRGNVDRKATLDKEHTGENYGVVKSAMSGGNYYAVRWCRNDNGETRHYLEVDKVWLDECLWYKPMDDTMGPCYYDCPKSILDLADKLCPCNDEYDPHGYAKSWRDKCRENIAKKRNPLAFANVKYGDSIIWHVPVGVGWAKEFEGKTLRLTKVKGKRCWVCYELWTGFKIKSVMVEDCEPDDLCKVA